MASDAQIRANRENAQKSTGPTSLEGKAQSRMNATTHSLSGAEVAISASSPERLAIRIAEWSDERAPQSERERWLFEKMAIATIRIDLCHDEENAFRSNHSQRAAMLWDEERQVDVETLGAKLQRNPGLMVAKLKRTVQGCTWLRERWESLRSFAETGDWDASQRALALDMLAVPWELREKGHHLPSGPDAEALEALARREIDKINATIDKGLILLDEREREWTKAGLMFIESASARLIRRYESEAWKTFWWAERELKACRTQPEPALRIEPESPTVAPIPIPPVPLAFTFSSKLSESVLRNEPKFPISDAQIRSSGLAELLESEDVAEETPTPESSPTPIPSASSSPLPFPRRGVTKNRKARRAAEAKERSKKS